MNMDELTYYLGVDGGQSSTTALIGDRDGRVLGYGRGGPCNHVGAAEGRTKFVSAIETCVATACAQAGVDVQNIRFEAACLGFSGGPAPTAPPAWTGAAVRAGAERAGSARASRDGAPHGNR